MQDKTAQAFHVSSAALTATLDADHPIARLGLRYIVSFLQRLLTRHHHGRLGPGARRSASTFAGLLKTEPAR